MTCPCPQCTPVLFKSRAAPWMVVTIYLIAIGWALVPHVCGWAAPSCPCCRDDRPGGDCVCPEWCPNA